MAKARREAEQNLRLVDAVIEVLDARLPLSSRNPMMASIIRRKPVVVAMAKADLADPLRTEEFVRAFRDGGISAVPVDTLRKTGMDALGRSVVQAAAPHLERLAKRGIRRSSVRAMVVGIPNVGKSALINRMLGRAATKTGDRPGITRQQQWVKTRSGFELLDTPGILWPRFEDPDVALRLAWSGAVMPDLVDAAGLAVPLLRWIGENYPDRLLERYGLSGGEADGQDPAVALETVARRRGALRPGGIPNLDAAADIVLMDFRSGRLGRITLDDPAQARSAVGEDGQG